MSNAKKILEGRGEKVPKEPRRKKVKDDLTKLPMAVVDGKLTIPDGARVVFPRTLDGRTRTHEGVFQSLDGNIMKIWDETRQQMYWVDVSDPNTWSIVRDGRLPARP